ncbi:epoxide hydrolase family protein [Micromonospora sp. NPDC047670]|uniref:epoxide hydrolase family protein n=1 Tax=Micromonospora sp. NPDC047670 TaxID=3364252 RepID=UPI00371F0BCC
MNEDTKALHPFRLEVSEAELADLRDRLARARWPQPLPGTGWSRGVPVDYLKELVDYWLTKYDWRAHEARLNQIPQFTTVIDGAAIHFLHARSPEPNALPLIITHGWPGSVAEFLNIIDPLTDPRRHGGDPSDAFHIVAPSIPGFGLSGPISEPGWDIPRIARAWAELMRRLGYDRYGGQGGDWGHAITRELGIIDADRLIGVHLNTVLTLPSGDPAEAAALSDEDRARLERFSRVEPELSGYAKIQGTRPQTLAYGLTDSPVGQLAWIVEKFMEWTDSKQSPDDAVDRDHLLTNVMLYWLTGTAGTSANLYYETFHPATPPANQRSRTPTGVAVFPGDTVLPVRRLAERDNHIIHWQEFDRGGHFAAMEQPDLLVGDIRAFFGQLRRQESSSE